jgi:hypothetical protein
MRPELDAALGQRRKEGVQQRQLCPHGLDLGQPATVLVVGQSDAELFKRARLAAVELEISGVEIVDQAEGDGGHDNPFSAIKSA